MYVVCLSYRAFEKKYCFVVIWTTYLWELKIIKFEPKYYFLRVQVSNDRTFFYIQVEMVEFGSLI